ncbi:hypothetical protein [Paenibacillus dendritiformis]|uniref:Uncharacterized protein n=1 Tax=Paenibacillus dendritiformis C454 TaxID=1131935 RepID=H3SB48_9BACL|nr:hypothetical protein [Paenibacillus dendritiformis]EHQ63781.1 hypothetical protein PDENDC454_03665 [Paenibacillus dendritiformis C454]CAH8772454.1 hypothetical protein H7S4_005193 [Paenibacillus dendritiformis]
MSIKGDVLPGGINQEIQGVTTQTRAHPDDFNPNVLKPLLDNDVTISKQLETLPSEALTFRPGYQTVESEQDTPFRLGEIKGRTLVNLLGRAGACDDLSLLGSFQTTNTIENETVKVIINKDGFGVAPITLDKVIKAGKYYLLAGSIKNGTAESASLAFGGNEGGGPLVPVTKKEDLQFVYMKKTSTKDLDKVNIDLGVIGSIGQYAYFDSIRLYEISEAEYNAIDSMTPEQVESHFPYVDSVTNVKNPYAIVAGGNLLPPFYEWTTYGAGATKVIEPYVGQVVGTGSGFAFGYRIPCISDTTYTFTVNRSHSKSVIALQSFDANGNLLNHNGDYIESDTISITTTKDDFIIGVLLGSGFNPPGGLLTFENPMLTIGTEPKSFMPQQRSMLAFETELAAHPVDCSNPDTIFMGDDGLPCVNEWWGKIVPDAHLGYHIAGNPSSTFKVVGVNRIGGPVLIAHTFGTKYDGTLLRQGRDAVATWEAPDIAYVTMPYIGETYSNAYISVANTDSGWGAEYSPTQDEIRAYFLGWRMFEWGRWNNQPYNRTDGLEKAWVQIGETNYSSPEFTTRTVPTTMATAFEYTPYRLQYLKSKPTVEPVRNYKLGATLTAGSNMVEVGSGIVLRERANPVYARGYGAWNINNFNPSSKLTHKTSRILSVTRNNKRDHQWAIEKFNPVGEYGAELATIKEYNFAPTAVYHVTYTMLDPTLPAPISGTVAANLRGTVSDLVQDVGDVERRLSVVETQKAEKDAAPPQWITPTLLNGWTLSSNGVFPVRYYKDGVGIVHVNGIVTGGATETVVFRLPAGYRPKTTIRTPSIIMSGTNVFIAYLDVKASGDVIAVFPTQSTHLTLQVSFLAEQ